MVKMNQTANEPVPTAINNGRDPVNLIVPGTDDELVGSIGTCVKHFILVFYFYNTIYFKYLDRFSKVMPPVLT